MNSCNLATELRFLSKKSCQDTLTFSKVYLLASSISKHTSGFLSVIQTFRVAMNSQKTLVKVMEIVLILKNRVTDMLLSTLSSKCHGSPEIKISETFLETAGICISVST